MYLLRLVTLLRVGVTKFNSLYVNCSSVWYYPASRVGVGVFDTQLCVDLTMCQI